MSDLADITAAGNSTVLAGWVLSPFRLSQHGQAEKEYEAAYLESAGKAAGKLPPATAASLLKSACEIVAGGHFKFGGKGHQISDFAATSLPLLLWLSLTPKHPQVTREQAAALITAENESALSQAVLECAGYHFRRQEEKPQESSAEPIDWKRVFNALSRRGIAPEQASQLTIPQLLNVLSADGSDKSNAREVTEDELAAKSRRARDEGFNAVCAATGRTPEELAGMPGEQLAALLRPVLPEHRAKNILPEKLPALAQAYAREKAVAA